MPALRELQHDFLAAVLHREDPAGLGLTLRPTDERQARRLLVYRVNTRENFAEALGAAFPVLRSELGGDEFASLAWSFQRAHPSRSGNLFEIGRALPSYLEVHLRGSEREYLHDLARLEWATQEAMVAADAPALDLAWLAAVPESGRGGLRFGLHPSVRILRTRYPVFDLWQRFQSGGALAEGARAATPAVQEDLLVHRAGEGIEIFRLAPLDACCLGCLHAGGTLADVADAALGLQAEPDLGAVLVRWAARSVLAQGHSRHPAAPLA